MESRPVNSYHKFSLLLFRIPTMSLELYILRHAKSDWGNAQLADEQRHLSDRGRTDAANMGQYFIQHKPLPDRIYCSTATRAQETLALVNAELAIADSSITYLAELYLASLSTLLNVISKMSRQTNSMLLIGHNPGLDYLVSYLSQQAPPLTDSGKLMTTCCLAHLSVSDKYKTTSQGFELPEACADLISITRPADL